MKTCDECGSRFTPDSGHQKRCRACINANPVHPRHRTIDPGHGTCRSCGKAFKRRTKNHVYCTQECKNAPANRTRSCRACGREFVGYANKQYCGDPCLAPTAMVWEGRKKGRACLGCGAPIEDGRFSYCSDKCRPKKVPKPRKKAAPLTRTCERCEQEWQPSKPGVQSKLCSACREAERELHVYTTTKSWRRAIRKRAMDRCEECGATERETGAYHHAHHVIPKSEGGPNTLANGKLLCVNCHNVAHGGGATGATPLAATSLIDQIAERVVQLLKEESLV